MKLTEDQHARLREWLQEGASPGEIQRRLKEEFDLPLTFMEVRFLIDDLDLSFKEQAKPTAGTADLGGDPKAPGQPADTELVDDGPAGSKGSVTVTTDALTRPGTVVSGAVTFSDGVSAKWALDSYGRLALEPSQAGYQPSAQDVQEFQVELSRVLERSGF
ncbi:MAG: hypothetical protein EA425_03165 [Puniceicoccaceae bacterium]|nr:MAG: hypothetical protein EA425_03165 [Puniceicoccaceae bacterium]